MSDPPSYDQDLLSRLNKLKKTSISLDQSNLGKPAFQSPSPTPETTLSERLRSLRNASASPSPSNSKPSASVKQDVPEDTSLFPSVPTGITESRDPLRDPFDVDDKTLDELLADLGADDQWKLDPDDPKDVQKLIDEAQKATAASSASRLADPASQKKEIRNDEGASGDWNQKYLSKDIDFSVFRNSDDDVERDVQGQESEKQEPQDSKKKEEEEDLEADAIVRRMLDEISTEETAPSLPPASSATKPKLTTAGDSDCTVSFPSAPTDLPSPSAAAETDQPSKKSLDFDSDISARLAALKGLTTDSLGMPSAPSFKPLDKPVKGVMKKPEYTDEEIDSWCVICQDDATVRCIGCEGDLYCAKCWKEGHMGPDAGYEEKTHKWAKYRKPR